MSCSSLDSQSSEDSETTTMSSLSRNSGLPFEQHEADDDTLTITPSETDSSEQRCCEFCDENESAICNYFPQHLNEEMTDLWTVFIDAQMAVEKVQVTLQDWCALMQFKIQALAKIIAQEKQDIRRTIDEEIDSMVDRGLLTIDKVFLPNC